MVGDAPLDIAEFVLGYKNYPIQFPLKIDIVSQRVPFVKSELGPDCGNFLMSDPSTFHLLTEFFEFLGR